MKKLILGFALACFVAFGTFSIQSAFASDSNMEIVKLQLDDDPDKNKKAEAKTDGKDKKGTKCCDKSKANCKDGKAKCETKAKCCPTKTETKEPKKEGDDKK
jgi:hypothetical protein